MRELMGAGNVKGNRLFRNMSQRESLFVATISDKHVYYVAIDTLIIISLVSIEKNVCYSRIIYRKEEF